MVMASLSLSQAKASNICIITKHFDLFQSTIDEYDLNNESCQLFNMDETYAPSARPLLLMLDGHFYIILQSCI